MRTLRLGDVQVDKVVEFEGPSFFPGFLIPDWDDAVADAARDWILPHFLDVETGRLILSVHSYLIRKPHHTILVDTCVGNHKERPSTKAWHQLDTPWLESLRGLGVAPEDVDFVLCTHLHVDHVGWNTRLIDGRWVPTFPNARYLFHRGEYAHWEAIARAQGQERGTEGCFEDSVLPVMEANEAVLIDGDHRIDDTLWLEPTPGHSPGHVCLHLESGGGHVVFTGDLMHHPLQCARPDWNSRFCHDADQSRRSRTAFVERHADTDTMLLAAHFATPTIGRIAGIGNGALIFKL